MSDAQTAQANAKKLLLVDGYGLLFRAFFAGRYLSTTDNRPTGALFGFTNMLFTLLNTEKPDAVVVCWDAPAQTLRSQEYEAYKAHRPEVDPQLQEQLPQVRRIVETMAVQSAELPGYEADDLIGTLACVGLQEGYSVTILTGDSDQLQLVRDGVSVQMTQRGVTEVKRYDADAVRERYGIDPERIPDWKALVGDTSDNIPGVPGIGEKTATTLLQQWGTLENLLAHVAEVTPPKARAALEGHISQAKFSKRLATIICDAPLEFTIRPYAPTDEDWQRVRELFNEFEFKTLLNRIPRTASPTPVQTSRPDQVFVAAMVRIQSAEELADALKLVQRIGKVAIRPDLTNDPPMRAKLNGLAFAPSAEVGYYVRTRPEDAQPGSDGLGGLFSETAEDSHASGETDSYAATLQELHALFDTPQIERVGHDVKKLEIVLERSGLTIQPFTFDTLLAAYLLNAGRSSYPLMDLAEAHLGVRLEPDDSFAAEETLALEAALIFALHAPLASALAESGMTEIMNRVEMPLIPVLSEIERAGLLVDLPYINTLSARMAQQIEALAAEIYELAGEEFNIGSTKQLQSILFDKLQLPTGKKTKTGFSTGADLLEQLAPQYEIARKIIDYRELAKLKATYADALVRLVTPETGRVHTSLNQTVANSGRLSSSDPNLQNIPVRSEIGREIRKAFIAAPGKLLLSCDYSQIELRILAHVTKDPALVSAFASDEDVHTATAATVFGVPITEVTPDQRRQAKTINFAVIYGQSGFSLAATLGVGASVANAWIKEYFERLPGVKRYIDETTALAHRQKYVTTFMGRRRYIPELDSSNHAMRQYAERAAVNMPIQGTAADIMKLAMIVVHDYLRSQCPAGCTLLLQVHDELLFEVEEPMLPTLVPEIVRRMEEAYPLDVRLKADAKIGLNWADMRVVSNVSASPIRIAL